MPTNFPGSLDTLSNPSGTNYLDDGSVVHADQHANANDAIEAVEAKIGTGASTPASGKVLRATGAGASAWGAVDLAADVSTFSSADLRGRLSDETGAGAAVFADTPTILTPTIASFANANHNHTNSAGGGQIPTGGLQDSAVTNDKVAAGVVVQVVSTNYNDVATGSTILPWDNTIPQNTEGDEYMSQAITPKSATNILVIEVKASVATTAVKMICGALFQDAVAAAIAADATLEAATNASVPFVLKHKMVAGTVSAITFKVRMGPETASTMTFNGVSGGRKFGGITASNIKITEYKA